MGHRITPAAWDDLRKNFAEDIKKMEIFSIPFDRCNIFPSYSRILNKKNPNRKKSKDKTNIERYGVELGPVLDWLDDNTNDQYYVEQLKDSGRSRATSITFYFIDETDAMAFKLMFGEKGA